MSAVIQLRFNRKLHMLFNVTLKMIPSETRNVSLCHLSMAQAENMFNAPCTLFLSAVATMYEMVLLVSLTVDL